MTDKELFCTLMFMWTIATPFSNKPEIIPLWLESFKRLNFPRNEFVLLWVDISQNPNVTKILKEYIQKHGHEFKKVIFIENPPKQYKNILEPMSDISHPLFSEKRRSVAETMNIINSHREGDLLLWEDDIIAPHFAWRNLKYVFDMNPLFLGVTGTQYRRERQPGLLSWNWEIVAVDSIVQLFIRECVEKIEGVEAIGASASGFTLYRKEFLDNHTFFVHDSYGQDIMTGFKINGYDQNPLGGRNKLIICWGVKLPHLGIDNDKKIIIYRSPLCRTKVPLLEDKPEKIEDFNKPWMEDEDIILIEEHLVSQTSRPLKILEWGSGGSTLHFSQLLTNKKIPYAWLSIENDKLWHDHILKKIRKNSSIEISLHPFEKEDLFNPHREHYILYPRTRNTLYDIIFIDGRERNKCLNEAVHLLSKNGIIFFHDAQRAKYSASLKNFPEGKIVSRHNKERVLWKYQKST